MTGAIYVKLAFCVNYAKAIALLKRAQMGWRIFKYIQHLFYRKHRHGHGIHSPYLFEFVNGVVFNGDRVDVPTAILRAHADLRKDTSLIPAPEEKILMGAQSKVDSKEVRTIQSFVRGSSVNRAQAALLFRIAHWLNPEMIMELGTGLGVSTIYLAAGLEKTSDQDPGLFNVHTIEGDPARALFSRQLFKRLGFNGVKVHQGDADSKVEELAARLPGRFLAFVDANHKYEPTLRYLRILINARGEESLIIMDDIYWSKGMSRAWNEVISWPEVRVSLDLFHMGILLLRKDLHKSHLKIKI
jgi:predicted O-methyltransferase YrrM